MLSFPLTIGPGLRCEPRDSHSRELCVAHRGTGLCEAGHISAGDRAQWWLQRGRRLGERLGSTVGAVAALLQLNRAGYSRADSAPTNAIRSMFVAPGVPSGTPATMITR